MIDGDWDSGGGSGCERPYLTTGLDLVISRYWRLEERVCPG